MTAIDAMKKTMTLDDEGGVLEFSKLLVCTGGVPRRLGVKGKSLSPTFGPSLMLTSTGSLPGEC